MGFGAPIATRLGRSTDPGFHPRFVPPSGFEALLTVSSLPRPADPEGPAAAHGVHPAERYPSVEPYAFRRRGPPVVSGIACSCSEDQKFTMPRDSRALLPTEIRTFRGPRPAKADALMGFFSPLQSGHRSPRVRFPEPCPRALSPPVLGRPGGRRFRELTRERSGRALAGTTDSLEVFHQDLSSGSPDDSGVLSE
jgi:hypothetical protein